MCADALLMLWKSFLITDLMLVCYGYESHFFAAVGNVLHTKHPKVGLKVSLRWYPIITIPTCSLDIWHTSVHIATENLLTFHCPGATFSQKVLLAKTYRQYCYTVHSDETCLPVYNSVSKHAVRHWSTIRCSKLQIFVGCYGPISRAQKQYWYAVSKLTKLQHYLVTARKDNPLKHKPNTGHSVVLTE